MLKSQVVPPVCPACPACPKAPSKVQCTNCGGQGGSGTLGTSGRSVVQSDGQTRGGDQNIINNAVNTTGDLATTTIKTADNLLRDTASGTVDIASGIGGGIMKLLTPEQQAQQRAQQQLNGQQAPLTGVQRQQSPQGTRTQYNEQQTRKPVSNDFSRNGLLPEKQNTDFMPITADFSSFGR